jgi:hypothetical protein
MPGFFLVRGKWLLFFKEEKWFLLQKRQLRNRLFFLHLFVILVKFCSSHRLEIRYEVRS